jgi:molybdate transport system ATP-binding protein
MIELDFRLPLAQFSLSVAARLSSDAVAVLGPSGAGKTSFLEALAGLRPGVEGRIAIDGEVLLDSPARVDLPPERRRMGYVPQDACLFPHLTARRNVRFGISGDERPGLFEEAIEILELAPLLDRYPATLSGGERQRVALARAIATRPRLLLLDEPLAAVDVELKERILPYLLRVRERLKIPCVYVTHNTGEAAAVAGEALLLRKGALVRQGPTAEILREMMASRVDPDARFDNVVAGELAPGRAGDDKALLVAGAARLVVPFTQAGEPGPALFAVSPEDILVSTDPPGHVSARNVLAGHVASLDASADGAWIGIEAAGLHWNVHLTRSAAEDLLLTPGTPVWLAIKALAFRRLR